MGQPEKRFLVIRLSSIGDIVHALPAVVALSEGYPRAQIHWVIEARFAPLIEGNPYVHRVVELDTLGWRRKFKFTETFEDITRGLLALREVEFDAAIDFQGLTKSGLIAGIIRSRDKVGFAANWLREPVAGVFYTDHVAPRGRRHIIEMNLALVERLGAYSPGRSGWKFPLPRTQDDDSYVERQLASLGSPEFVVINPGGGWKSKRWAPENYAELIRRLEPELDWHILLTGSAEEEKLIQAVIAGAGTRRASYFPSTLVQLIALTRRARLFIGGDTGPAHLAAAVGTPLVAIYDSSDPLNTADRNGPFRADDVVVSTAGPPNHARRGKSPDYLPGVSVDSVLTAVRRRLSRVHG